MKVFTCPDCGGRLGFRMDETVFYKVSCYSECKMLDYEVYDRDNSVDGNQVTYCNECDFTYDGDLEMFWEEYPDNIKEDKE